MSGSLAVAELLVSVMPDSDAGKAWTLLILVFFVLTVTSRFKLEWIGTGIVWIGIGIWHIYRRLRCKICDKHYWEQRRPGLLDHLTGLDTGTFVCVVCGKKEFRQ